MLRRGWRLAVGALSVNSSGWRVHVEGWLLLLPAISAYLAMNFTGASTYTSLSGVKKELGWAVPLEIASGTVGLICWLAARFLA